MLTTRRYTVQVIIPQVLTSRKHFGREFGTTLHDAILWFRHRLATANPDFQIELYCEDRLIAKNKVAAHV